MQAMKRTGDTDKDFAMMMKLHHQQALDMARAETVDEPLSRVVGQAVSD